MEMSVQNATNGERNDVHTVCVYVCVCVCVCVLLFIQNDQYWNIIKRGPQQ